jgi:hypothetical protein
MDPPGVEPGSPPRQGGALPLGDEPERQSARIDSFRSAPARVPKVDRRGVEPRSPACDTGVVPLDQQPVRTRIELDRPGSRTPISWLQARCHPVRPAARVSDPSRGPPESRTRSASLQERDAPGTPADHCRRRSMNRVVPEGIEPPFPLCKRGVVAVGPRDVEFTRRRSRSNSTGGSRTHRHQTLSLTAMPVRVPCRQPSELRARESNHGLRVYETRLSAGPPAMESQAPVPSRAAGLMRAGGAPATPERSRTQVAPRGVEPPSPP